MKVQIVNKSNNPLPQYKTKGSVGMDLAAYIKEPIYLQPNCREIIPTGIHIAIPEGYELQIRPRSGLSFNYGILDINTPGTIDQDYRGEIKVLLYNSSKEIFIINNGDRIAQMVVCPIIKVELEEVQELDSTERGEKGFGSTGITSAITAENVEQPSKSGYIETYLSPELEDEYNASLFDAFYENFNPYDNVEQEN